MMLAAELRLSSGDPQAAIAPARRALGLSRDMGAGDPVTARMAMAEANRLLGDALGRIGNRDAARIAFRQALAALPAPERLKPREQAVMVQVLNRNGELARARKLSAHLNTIGYRLSTG